jgi:large subunit ribosomal protein L29
MKARDLRDRTTEDLAELERSLSGEFFQNKFKNFTNRLDDTSVINKSKRDLARVKLILGERARGVTVVYKAAEATPQKPKTRPAKAAPKVKEAAETGTEEKAAKGEAAEAKEAPKKKAASKPAMKAAPAVKAKAKEPAEKAKPAAKAAAKPKAKSEKGSK